MKRKEHEDIELKLTTYKIYSSMLPKKAHSPPQRTNNVPHQIKKLAAGKIWQKTHTPDSRRKYNRKATN